MNTELSSPLLKSFHAVASLKSFGQAAEQLGVTQPALSLRIQRLEAELGQRLFIRNNKKVVLTELGEALLHYHNTRKQLDEEFLATHVHQENELVGVIKIGAFSTYSRSQLIPKLDPFLKKHPRVRVDIQSKEIDELLPMLKSGQVDYIYSLDKIDLPTVKQVPTFKEKNVLIESKKTLTSQRYIY